MISTWTAARFIACFCTVVLVRNNIMIQGLPAPSNDVYLSISIKKLDGKIQNYVAKNKGSYVFSPYGLSHAMNVLYLGAVGETRSQIRKWIFNGMSEERIEGAHEVLISINSQRNQSLQVRMASLIAVHSNVNVLPSYQQDVAKLKAKYLKLDFTEKSAKNAIYNDLGTGTDVLMPIFLDSAYELKPPSLLANSIEFMISWDLFQNGIQQQLPFRNIGTPVKNVTMLTLEGTFEFYKFKIGSMIGLPYGDQYNIYFILPETPDMLTKVQDEVLKEFHGDVYGMRDRHLQVTIPRFKVNHFHNMNEGLKGLGVRKAFEKDGSGLTNITKDKDFFLREVVQRAVVDFGYESSSIPVGKPKIVDPTDAVLVDQPFFFVIRDKSHELPLFKGRVENID